MTNIFHTITANASPLVQLIGKPEPSFAGFLFNTSFDETYILTNDSFKEKVNGLPLNSFLVAAGFNPETIGSAHPVDREVLLLRILEPVALPQERDFIAATIQSHQKKTVKEMLPGLPNDGLDPITASELQWGGLRCRILGSFYVDGDQELRLGSDLETFTTLSRMRAYKPTEKALEMIINHVNPEVRRKSEDEARKAGFGSVPAPILIGKVRYTSTNRLQRLSGDTEVPVTIQPSDFLARRTAVLGMTRTGKSNTVKTTVSAVAMSALRSNVKIGQIIFDVNGEYANANSQDDGSSINDVFGDMTVRYRAIDTPGFQDLRANFYSDPGQGINLLQNLLKNEADKVFTGQDIEMFLEVTLTDPPASEHAEMTRWRRHVAAFQCMLHRASYPAPNGFLVEIPIPQRLVQQVQEFADAHQITIPNLPIADRAGFARVTLDQGCEWFELVRQVNVELKKQQDAAHAPAIGLEGSSRGNPWMDPSMEVLLNMIARKNSGGNSIGGWRAIAKYVVYHSSRRQSAITAEILEHLDNGKIVILDLSAGPVEIRKVLSDRIATQIFNRQMGMLNEGRHPQNVVVYVEEAHNLIGRKSELDSTWPRMAKEGAKARIAFVYATQEPSSVHPNILANTENWFVTHLNNDDEIKTLGKFYDFSDFGRSLKNAQDVGFARIKTLSSPFVIPTQINRFDPADLKAQIEALPGR